MKRNSRLSLALHTLGHMAGDPEQLQTSAQIAEHARTNAVVVRRVLGKLRDAGLLVSEKGHSGGWKLAREPNNISLADIYTALEEQLFPASDAIEKHQCPVEHALHTRVSTIMSDVEHIMLERLSATSVADMLEPI